MKKCVAFAFLTIALSLILLPASTSVNQSPTFTISPVADGNPIPPPIPPKSGKTFLIADGNPLPPPIPPKSGNTFLIADGNPIPPPIPPKSGLGIFAV